MKNQNRKRRRIVCTQCGNGFSSSWYKEHKSKCQMKNQVSQPRCQMEEGDYPYETPSVSEYESSDIEELSEIQELGSQVSNTVTAQFSKLLKGKGCEEDVVFFESCRSNEDDETNERSDESVQPPPTESWDNTDDDHGLDEEFEVSEQTDNNQSQGCDSKIESLVMWLMLFLCSWQSTYSITDTALSVIIKFLCRFFWLMGAFDSTMATVARLFPNSHYKLRKGLGLYGDSFIKYVVCPKCKSIYKFEDCVQTRSGQKVSGRCKFVPWPNHPHRRKRGELCHFNVVG